MTSRLPSTLAAASLLTVVLAGCASTPPETTPSDDAATQPGSGTPVAGGILRFGDKIVDCADPHQRGNNPNSFQLKPILDNLLAQDLETGEYLPWLATEWEVNEDATEFVFTVRDDVTFSDGTPLTPQAVASSIDATVNVLGAAASLPSGYLNDYASAEVVGSDQVKFTFSEPNIAFLQGAATGNLGIVAEATSALSAEERCVQGAIGSGPFSIAEYVPTETLRYVKRADYAWANPLAENQGAAHLDGIEIVSVQDTSVLAGSLLSDQIDAYSVVLPQDHAQITAAGGRVLTTTNGGYPVALLPNVQDPVLSDKAVRQAIQIGFDRATVIQGVIGDWFQPSESALSHTTVGYTDLSDRLAYDPDKARSILDTAGWTVGPDGIRVKDGERLSFDITGEFSWNDSPSVAAIIKEQLKDIGVEVEINLLPTGQQADVFAKGEQAARWVNGYTPEPDTLRAVLGFETGNWSHRTARDSFDDLLDRQVQLADVTERNAVLAQIQEVIIDEGYLIPIYDWAQSFAVAGKVHGPIQLPFLSGPGPLYSDIWLGE